MTRPSEAQRPLTTLEAAKIIGEVNALHREEEEAAERSDAGRETMTRAERRRAEREIAKARPMPGVGKGFRLTPSGRRYPVQETRLPSLEVLERESDAAIGRSGT